jgi:NAD(P)-dependent dehydrogenase (short-subunit alcohol dehydrogenase family)
MQKELRMQIIVVGGEGDIGRAVCQELGARHDIVTAGRTRGDLKVDMADRRSVEAMYAKTGPVDAVVSTAGEVHFGPLADFTEESFMLGLRSKVMGQINLVLAGLDKVKDGGSFTLTSGVLDRDPIRMGTGAAAANGALGGFAVGAAIEMPRGLRINVVSPGLLESSVERYGAWFPGHLPIPDKKVALAYAKSVEGAITGKVIIVE